MTETVEDTVKNDKEEHNVKKQRVKARAKAWVKCTPKQGELNTNDLKDMVQQSPHKIAQLANTFIC